MKLGCKLALTLLAGLLPCQLALTAVGPLSIPRTQTKQFRDQGLFEGGSYQKANLEAVRYSKHPAEGFERWVIDFSSPTTREVGRVAPRFQLQYFKADRHLSEEGKEVESRPAKFLFLFRAIQANFLKREQLLRLAQKSAVVKEIVLYPPIEQGDMAMEFVLNQDVLFDPHQPLEKEGRLVLDLKPAFTVLTPKPAQD